METLKTIKAGQTLSARSIGDYNCIFTCEVISRSKSFVTVKVQGNVKKCKVSVYDNTEMIYALGNYSMAPAFKAN
jgi:hypothetical protein